MIANAGIERICYGEFYRDVRIFQIAKKLKMELVKVGGDVVKDSKEQIRLLSNGHR